MESGQQRKRTRDKEDEDDAAPPRQRARHTDGYPSIPSSSNGASGVIVDTTNADDPGGSLIELPWVVTTPDVFTKTHHLILCALYGESDTNGSVKELLRVSAWFVATHAELCERAARMEVIRQHGERVTRLFPIRENPHARALNARLHEYIEQAGDPSDATEWREISSELGKTLSRVSSELHRLYVELTGVCAEQEEEHETKTGAVLEWLARRTAARQTVLLMRSLYRSIVDLLL